MGPRPLLALLCALAMPLDAGSATPDGELEGCLAAHAPSEPRALELRLRSEQPGAPARETRAVLSLTPGEPDGFRALLRVSAPEELRDTAFLWRETGPGSMELFVYLPEVDKVRKLRRRHLKGRLFDSDVTYGDVERLVRAVRHTDALRSEEGDLDGRGVWIVEGTASEDDEARIRSWIDRRTCLPLRTEFFDDDVLRKIVEVDPARIERVGESWLPGEVVVRDARRAGETRLVLTRLEVPASLPPDHFEPEGLARRTDAPR